MNADLKLIDYGDSIMQAIADNCSDQADAEEFMEFLFRNTKLECKKCSHEFDIFQKKLMAAIDKIVEFKNSQFAVQYRLAQTLGILSSGDEAQCPKCGSGEAVLVAELQSY